MPFYQGIRHRTWNWGPNFTAFTSPRPPPLWDGFFVDSDGVIRSTPDYSLPVLSTMTVKAQLIFQNFPHLSEWETKDLFSKHPTGNDLWRFRDRKDDIVVLSNARNIIPNLMEEPLAAHQKVKAALLGGSGKSHTFLLIEVTEPPEK